MNKEYADILTRFGIDNKDDTFRYQLLSRMQSDCDYFLGNGNRHTKHLWADNARDHIACMKALWHSFSEDGKPEWLPYDKILDYEKQMVGLEVLFTFGTSKQFPFELGYVSITAPSLKMAIEEFRRNYPDVNEGILNCSDYYFTEESKAQIREHGNGAGCHRRIVVSSMDLTVDDLLADASARSGGAETTKNDVGLEKE